MTLRAAALLLVPLLAAAAAAEPIRIATYNASLTRNGPGLLLEDIIEPDTQVTAAAAVIRAARPDILLLNEFDFDFDGVALAAFLDLLRQGPDGIDYPYSFAPGSNTGEPSGLDLDGDGRAHGPADAFGFGEFPGRYAMALVSRLPLDTGAARSFRLMPWRDLPGALLPVRADGTPFPSPEAQAVMRLSSKAHWDVPVDLPGGTLHLLASHPTPPVFDGPEDMNGRRNHDEIIFWAHYLDGTPFTDDAGTTAAFAGGPFVLLGDLNADPMDGDGLHDGIRALLTHPALTDPRPESAGGIAAASEQGGANRTQRGPPARDTADFRDDAPGNLRADYVLPSVALTVTGSGIAWPLPGEPLAEAAATASDHRLVWVDIDWP